MKLNTLQVLSDSEVRQIHEASLDILANCGVKILNPRSLDLLASKGLAVDLNTMVVRFTRTCVEEALAKIPRQFDVFDREGRFVFTLGDGTPRVAAGHNAVFWVDSETGKTRPSTVADVEMFARICDKLPHIDVLGIPVMPQDVANPNSSLVYAVKACIENSTKPIYFSTDKPNVNRACIELLKAAFKGDLVSQVYGIGQLSPTSPLFWEESVCEALEETVKIGIPLAILPEPNAGVSAPYTLAGLLTIDNAECLSGLVMSQLIKPGAKVLYANSWTTTDMRTGAALVGSVETTICRIAGAQLARFYNVPCHTTAPNSDNHAHDEQNSWEKTLSQFCSIAAGNDLIVNCGMFATGMTCSHEQLIMDEEISAMSRRLVRGVEVTADTIAVDLIKRIGPQGEGYLTADHTFEHLHGDEYYMPRLAVRGPRASWEAAGSKDTYEIAKDWARKLAAEPAPALDPERKARLEEIVREFMS
ncbi:MAG: trimethylamine methyltransferase family protein [Armatimonadetes bacterium]|nr:trimethylamine methyltransferase family protein [Armatimonadota bacterium]